MVQFGVQAFQLVESFGQAFAIVVEGALQLADLVVRRGQFGLQLLDGLLAAFRLLNELLLHLQSKLLLLDQLLLGGGQQPVVVFDLLDEIRFGDLQRLQLQFVVGAHLAWLVQLLPVVGRVLGRIVGRSPVGRSVVRMVVGSVEIAERSRPLRFAW